MTTPTVYSILVQQSDSLAALNTMTQHFSYAEIVTTLAKLLNNPRLEDPVRQRANTIVEHIEGTCDANVFFPS